MTTHSLEYWQEKAANIAICGQAYVNGSYVDAISGETFECVNPATEQVIANIASCDQADADKAVAIAKTVFEKGLWADLAPVARKKILIKFADLIEQNAEELALLETLDMGKPITEALNTDIPAVVNSVRWTAEAIDKVYDEVAPTGIDAVATITREAIGVVAAIVPWNFPLWMAAWKFAPALAMGNSFILKPSEKSSLTGIRVAELAKQAGIPDGVFQVLPGFGHTVGKALALHMDVDCLVFTGSTRTGKLLMEMAGQSNLKKVWLECGGKSPNLVFADCEDLKAAATAAAWAIFYNQGEVCIAASRLLVEESIKDEFIELVKKAAAEIRPGDPLDPKTNMGAVVDKQQLDTVMHYINKGIEQGANIALGGERVAVGSDKLGCFVEPTIFDNVSNDMAIAQEEIFGPVLSVISFKDEADAIQIANDCNYGLGAAVWTSNLNRAHRVSRKLRAGLVWVNCHGDGDMTMPFGGYKQSGNGRDKSLHAMDKYCELKSTYISLK
jgi:4-guanidinobutyraldehyde dehydrogenase/NAD-dependent aldehyde dehydrogenase